MGELNNFNQISFASGMFMHQIISAPLFGLALFFFISAFFNMDLLDKLIQSKLFPIYIIIYCISLISGLGLDLGLDLYWQDSLLADLSSYKYGRSSILGFVIVNTTILLLMSKKLHDRGKPLLYFFLCIGSLLLFFWSFIVNTIMQKPELIALNYTSILFEINFIKIISDEFFLFRMLHYLNASFLQAVFIVLIGVSMMFRDKTLKLVKLKNTMMLLIFFGFSALLVQLVSGHYSFGNVVEFQGTKASSALGIYKKEGQPKLYIVGLTNSEKQETHGIAIPDILAKTILKEINVLPLDSFNSEDLPHTEVVFQSFHLMILSWVLIFFFFSYISWRLLSDRIGLNWKTVVLFLFVTVLATQSGWVFAETGRKPWLFFNAIKYTPTVYKPYLHLLFNNIILQLALLMIALLWVVRKFKSDRFD